MSDLPAFSEQIRQTLSLILETWSSISTSSDGLKLMDGREVSVQFFSSSSGVAALVILARVLVPDADRGRNSTCHDWVVTAVVDPKLVGEMGVVRWSVCVVDIVIIAVTAVVVTSE